MVDRSILTLITPGNTIALVGASHKEHRASYRVMEYLLHHGYQVIPVNPGKVGSQILGCDVIASLQDIEQVVDGVNVFRRSEFIPALYQDILAMASRPKWLWLQQDIVDHQVAQAARTAGMAVVMDRCLMIELEDYR